VRVSPNTSLIAAQIWSVSTSTMPSSSSRHSAKVSAPTCFTATPSANKPTWSSLTRRPAFSDRAIASASTGSTPITLTDGRSRLMYDAIPEISPPPPTGTKTASGGCDDCLTISRPIVPWPAMTSGSS
jgi:hypothetical protein